MWNIEWKRCRHRHWKKKGCQPERRKSSRVEKFHIMNSFKNHCVNKKQERLYLLEIQLTSRVSTIKAENLISWKTEGSFFTSSVKSTLWMNWTSYTTVDYSMNEWMNGWMWMNGRTKGKEGKTSLFLPLRHDTHYTFLLTCHYWGII